MRWKGRPKSSNIEDRRSMRPSATGGMGGGLRLLPLLFRFLGFKGTLLLIAGVLAYGIFTGSLGSMLYALGLGGNPPTTVTTTALNESPEEKQLVEFVSVVLADTEQTWSTIFEENGQRYQEPRLVLYRGVVRSACGTAQSAVGPFYCPGDQQIYLDLNFFDELANRFAAPGDFAQAYVIAHEVGHHIQTLMGISAEVHAARSRLSTVEANKLSVKQELQADCFAGIWANHANDKRQLLETGDIEEGLRAASAIGDDTLQKQSQGHVSPDSFTHGSSQQRMQWFTTGFETGDITRCNTFEEF
ncbi:KPN_02809 family neutral zinc metallopeptidase [Methylophaga muralis]|uniref:Putative neutral zinc metallopeptidase n=1 Tax=Methylophaga muralis TaxID=291169 RepID=A0A1E3GND6_9GAMM|nr:neutral zinc metallopeptidase [Methylophaga muralis]ODN65544.1 putative neutral zinc metallopeptidase [Methylophaga muralis]